MADSGSRPPGREQPAPRQAGAPPQPSYAGAELRAPGSGHHSPPGLSSPPSGAAPRSAARRPNEAPEHTIQRIILHPCFRGQVKSLSLFAVLSLIAIAGSSAFPSLVVPIQIWGDSAGGGYLFIPLLTALPLIPLLRAIIAVYDSTYVIDDDGIEARIGLLSLKLRLPKLRWEDIRGSALKQGLLERVLNVGTIDVDSAMTEDVEIVMAGIADARTIHQLIMKERERRWRAAGHLWHVEKALTD